MKILKNIFKYFLISLVWASLISTILWIKKPTDSSLISLPASTSTFIQITPKEILKGLLFDVYFKNNDVEITNALHSYIFSKNKPNSRIFLEYDLSKPLYLVQCIVEGNPTWLLKGIPKDVPFISTSPLFIYSKKTNELYSFIGKPYSMKDKIEIQKSLFQNNLHFRISNASLSAYSIANRKINSSYFPRSFNNILKLAKNDFRDKERKVLVSRPNSFHLTSELNGNRLLPSYIKEYSSIIDKLKGFSLNYYGAESNSKTDFLSPVPRFELLLNFKQALVVDSLIKIIALHIPKEAIITPGTIQLYYKNYYIHQVDSCTIYLSSNIYRKNKIGYSNRSLLFLGQPKYLTQIKNLGIWETVLSFIPTYKSTDFFFNSIEKIVSNDKASEPAINIVFKKNVIPSIELLRLFLALNNPVEN
jgi:hypothetical protein